MGGFIFSLSPSLPSQCRGGGRRGVQFEGGGEGEGGRRENGAPTRPILESEVERGRREGNGQKEREEEEKKKVDGLPSPSSFPLSAYLMVQVVYLLPE